MEVSILKLAILFFLPLICKAFLLFTEDKISGRYYLKDNIQMHFVSLCIYYLCEFFAVSIIHYVSGVWLFCKNIENMNISFITLVLIIVIFTAIHLISISEMSYYSAGVTHCVVLFIIIGIFTLCVSAYTQSTSTGSETLVQDSVENGNEITIAEN